MKRDLATIGRELQAAVKHDTKNALKIGRLLVEAKNKCDHGTWLAWLRENGSVSVRSAQEYMAAAEFAAKYATVAHLKISRRAIYLLASGDYPTVVICKALKEAETRWINQDDVRTIIHREVTLPERRAAPKVVEQILDGPLPELPETETTIPVKLTSAPVPVGYVAAPRKPPDELLNEMSKQAVALLSSPNVVAKPPQRWVGLVDPEQLRRARELLAAIEQAGGKKADAA
jgi:hypothetical protein